MIKKWRLGNFKSVRELMELNLAPLTLLAGPNSSGKSTLIQSILLLCQSTSNQDPERSIVLNGSLTLLGEHSDICNFGSDDEEITIGWELAPSAADSSLRYKGSDPFVEVLHNQGLYAHRIEKTSGLVKFDWPKSTTESQTSTRLTFCRLEAQERHEDSSQAAFIELRRSDENRKLIQSKLDFPELVRINFGEGTEFKIEVDSQSLEEIALNLSSAEVIGSGVNHFLPQNLIVSYNLAAEILKGLQDFCTGRIRLTHSQYSLKFPMSLIERIRAADFINRRMTNLFDLGRWLSKSKSYQQSFERWFASNRTDIESEIESENKFTGTIIDLPSLLEDASKYTELFFAHNIRYLGPLRDAPKSVYPLSTRTDSRDLGLKGENTAAVLHQFKSKPVRFLPPDKLEAALAAKDDLNSVSSLELNQAVNLWLSYLGVAESVQTRDRGKEGHEMKIRTQGLSVHHDLTHAGVGVSQVVPIVVMGLLAGSGACMLFEQPELHLHPMVQSRLADFFVMLGIIGKQCIVETHSEYIVDRLRFRTVQADKESLLSLFKIYFVEKRGGSSSFKEISVSQFGAIEQWPEGFFDQTQKETTNILLAATEKLESLE